MHQGADAKFREAAALHAQGRLAEAAAAYQAIVQAAPNHLPALCNLATLYRQLGRPAEAVAYADRAIALDARLPQAHAVRADSLTVLKRFDDALQSYASWIALAPTSADAHANHANVLRELGRAEEAVAGCDRALALNPRFVGAHVFRGYALLELHRAAD